MNWIVAGLIAGVGAFFSDYVMWGKVFTGPEVHGFATMPPTPEEQKKMMLPAMLKSAALALVFGVDQSPRVNRSSIVIESECIHCHFSAITSLTLRPVQIAV